ncbi:hypothetical protein PVAND_004694 [Polypedilum vanderplanki]|uniref:Uncharacterized protein n=1 Tax=Polypedilum vanderplanki TaxID=319348 RepID=A0A9J6BXZ5_POLVA|nr:hypothetical protein PVAND_004694 [Polypedilum vanderplanki]
MNAVEVRAGYKYYGKDKDPKIVLNRINMTVTHGSIYGLLGASGCGKTTLLSCIVGVKFLNEGKITVLGGTPGKMGSGVPGPRVGYMPQEIALTEEFSIKETIYYFGRIYGMSTERIRERYKLLRDLLDLPTGSRQIGHCSGGQQRRVSFAAAMVHEPELLILDEPTVGLDPLLREKIWDFLVETTRTSKLAVIITTHYIEEARQANCIGLMRNGILLAEDSPQSILSKYEVDSLEDAFLQLCVKHGVSDEADENLKQVDTFTSHQEPIEIEKKIDEKPSLVKNEVKRKNSIESNDSETACCSGVGDMDCNKKSLVKNLQITTKRRMKALLAKNFLQMLRQPAGMVFLTCFPIFQLVCFYVAVGGNPIGLKLAIVNDEIQNINDCMNSSLVTTHINNDTCDLNKVSCRFINQINNTVAIKYFYDTFDAAYQDAKKGKVMGVIYFAKNFTQSMADIRDEGRFANEGSFFNAEIQIFMDKSDQQLTFFLEKKLRQTYQEFAQSLMADCNYPVKLGNIPIDFEQPIYGSYDGVYTDYIAPGVVMTMVFFLATLITSTIFITDRLEGVWDRTLVAGISTTELLIAHIITQSTVMLVQCCEIVILAAFIFDTENRGDNFTVIFLLMLLGFSGMLYGLFISIFCDSHTMANFMATGSFYPMIILCGIFWPLEGMSIYLQYIAFLLPFTLPSIAVRNILAKGWSIAHASVIAGYGITVIWIVVLLTLCLIGLKIKK